MRPNSILENIHIILHRSKLDESVSGIWFGLEKNCRMEQIQIENEPRRMRQVASADGRGTTSLGTQIHCLLRPDEELS